MFAYTTSKSSSLKISRRRFVQGLAAGGVIAGFDLWRWPALAMRSIVEPAVLTGSHFDLVVDETPVNFTGRALSRPLSMVRSLARCSDGVRATRLRYRSPTV